MDSDFDPERALWVPGRKRIFIPAAREPEFQLTGIDWGKLLPSLHANWMPTAAQERFLGMCDECSPSRSGYLAIPRVVPVTYNDIQRSETPAFRSSWRRRNFW